VVVPWANGLGTTSVIARWPDNDQWVWRLSLADVVSDGPFSQLPGVDRFIAVASGEGMELTVGDLPPIRLTLASPPFGFDGGAVTTCALIDGPIVDLNLMVRRGTATASLEMRRLAPGAAIDITACVVLDGAAAVGDDTLERFDAVFVDHPHRLTALEPTRLAQIVGTTGRRWRRRRRLPSSCPHRT
jgi:uncharacterized protein